MIWVTWRQHRVQAIGMLVLLAVIAVYAVAVGAWMRSAFGADGLGACLARSGGAGCEGVITSFTQKFNLPVTLANVVTLPIPAYLGAVVGAPLLGTELGRGTWQLAWSQTVPRRRWLAAKLGLVSGALVVFGAAVTLLLTWARSPLDRVSTGPGQLPFSQGILLPCELLCGFSLALLAGLLLRNAIGAMVVGYIAWEAPFTAGILMTGPLHILAVTKTIPCAGSACAAASASSFPPVTGHVGDQVFSVTPGAGHLIVSYLPASDVWPVQLIVGGMYLAIAAAAIGATLWLLHRRTT